MTGKIKAILLKRPMSTFTRANLLIYGLSFIKKVTGSFCCTGWLNKRGRNNLLYLLYSERSELPMLYCHCKHLSNSIKQFSKKKERACNRFLP